MEIDRAQRYTSDHENWSNADDPDAFRKLAYPRFLNRPVLAVSSGSAVKKGELHPLDSIPGQTLRGLGQDEKIDNGLLSRFLQSYPEFLRNEHPDFVVVRDRDTVQVCIRTSYPLPNDYPQPR